MSDNWYYNLAIAAAAREGHEGYGAQIIGEKALAELTGCNIRAVQKWVEGGRQPNAKVRKQLEELARELGVEIP